MNLRWYQKDALEKVIEYIQFFTGNPVVVLPTGAGKSPLASAIAAHYVAKGLRVLVLAHVLELVVQNAQKLQAFSDVEIGIYSAGAKKRDIDQAIIFASIQSVAANKNFPTNFDIILIDECHRVPNDGAGQYRTVIERQTNARIIGMTATPFRLGDGYIYGDEKFFSECVFEVSVAKLIEQGFLSNLRTKATAHVDVKKLKIRGGEFAPDVMAEAFQKVSTNTAEQVMKLCADRKSWVVFASGVEHAHQLFDIFNAHHIPTAIVTGETKSDERAQLVEAFKQNKLRCLVNVNCFREGFDSPSVDAVILACCTTSTVAFAQMCGRGLRRAEGKKDCLILDFGGNIQRHGPLDNLLPATQKRSKEGDAPVKSCPNCFEVLHLSARECHECGFKFERKPNVQSIASTDAILTKQENGKWYAVNGWQFHPHQAKGKPPCIRITYRVGATYCTEFQLPEHGGAMSARFNTWWVKASNGTRPPKTVGEALARSNELQMPKKILVVKNGKYLNVKTHSFH